MTERTTGRQQASTNGSTGTTGTEASTSGPGTDASTSGAGTDASTSGAGTDASTGPEPSSVPATIESSQAKLVYVYLSQHGEATVDALADALGLRKLGLFDVLATLESAGLVERDGVETVRVAA